MAYAFKTLQGISKHYFGTIEAIIEGSEPFIYIFIIYIIYIFISLINSYFDDTAIYAFANS